VIEDMGINTLVFLLERPVFGASYYNAVKPEQADKLAGCCEALANAALQLAKTSENSFVIIQII
jgi:hypothetical protein